jgi:streptomycin 6-kinase
MIDPKGVIAGPEFELGAMLRNPFPQWPQDPDLPGKLRARLALIATDQRFSAEPVMARVLAWAFVQAVLAACWSDYEPGEVQLWLRVAEVLNTLGRHTCGTNAPAYFNDL